MSDIDRNIDRVLSAYGYEWAQGAGLLETYMKMLNRSGSGGYTEAHLEKARGQDDLVSKGERDAAWEMVVTEARALSLEEDE